MSSTTPTSTCTTYEIRVAGHLDDHWSAMLGDLTLVRLDDGTTSLTGPIVDQAQLHGVLASVRDLGVPLLSLRVADAAAAAVTELASTAQAKQSSAHVTGPGSRSTPLPTPS